MAWTTPQTWANGRVNRGDLNTHLRDNLLALKYPPTAKFETAQLSDYSTTSTSFVDIDATNLALTITTVGDGVGGNGDVMIGLSGTLYSAASIRIYLALLRDGSIINRLFVSEGAGMRPCGFMYLDTNVTPGEHTYKLQWSVSSGTGVLNASAATSGRNTKAQFWVREMS